MDVVANNYGLAFSISPTKKKVKKPNDKDEDDEEYTLTLAPFCKAPKINFGEVKINTIVERTVLIINPQQFDVKLNVTNQDLEINNFELCIAKQENVYFKIKWQPEKPNHYKYSIMFEVTNAARLKFLVHAFGVCVAPPTKGIRKPVTTFKPLKKDEPKQTAKPAPKPTLKPVTTNTTSTSTTQAKKSTHSITATIKPAPQPVTSIVSQTKLSSTDKTFLIQNQQPEKNVSTTPKFNYSKLAKAPSVDIYNLYDEDSETEQNSTIQNNHLDLRRQTCIIASPKIFKNQDGSIRMITNPISNSNAQNTMHSLFVDEFNNTCKLNDKTPMRRSISSGNLDTTGLSFVDATLVVVAGGINQHTHYNFNSNEQTVIHKNYSPSIFSTVKKQDINPTSQSSLTPKLIDFLKPSHNNNNTTNSKMNETTKPLATQLNYDYEESTNSSTDLEQQIINSTILISTPHSNLPVRIVIELQKQWRMKRFRKRLRELKYQIAQDAIKQAMANTQRLIELEREREHKLLINGFTKLQRHFRMKQFRKYVSKLRHEKEQELKRLELVKTIQKQWRMKQFRKSLAILKHEHTQYLNAVILCQRLIRKKLFRINLNKLKQNQNKLIKCVVNCQRIYRKKKFRRNLNRLKIEIQAANRIKHQWHLYKFRQSMNKYHQSANLIQKWIRSMKERFLYLKLKRGIVQIQKLIRLNLNKRNHAALIIQTWFRSHREQNKYNLKLKSIYLIQNWIRSKKQRIAYLNIKRNKSKLELQIKGVILIQRQWRFYRFKCQMNKYRQAAITIQTWHRSMKLRYEFLRKKNIICQIQALYRRVYLVRRSSAAIKIQCAWRKHKAIKTFEQKRIEYLEQQEVNRYNRYATKIQSLWRGYAVRKQTDQILHKIRTRLSCYVPTSTLGVRIRNSLRILSIVNVPIQQIIIALIDLDKVTRLSPECCNTFVQEGAINILYTFLLNCNRSVPHMDLIKLCLKILINLAKFNDTVMRIMEPNEALFILSNLLLSYHTSNPAIFMDACILFILLAQCKPLNDWFLSQSTLIKKLLNLHSTLERKTMLKLKSTNHIINPLSASNAVLTQQQALNTTIISSAGVSSNLPTNKKSLIVSFTILPEWSLSKKTPIDLVDPLGALAYFLDCLKIKAESTLRTPSKKVQTINLVRELSSSSSKQSLKEEVVDSGKQSAKVSRIPLSQKNLSNPTQSATSTSRQLNFNKQDSADENNENHDPIHEIDDHVSILSNESYSAAANTTFKSIASSFYNEEPKLNSTSISSISHQSIKPKTTIQAIYTSNNNKTNTPNNTRKKF